MIPLTQKTKKIENNLTLDLTILIGHNETMTRQPLWASLKTRRSARVEWLIKSDKRKSVIKGISPKSLKE